MTRTTDDAAAAVARLALGVVMFPHAAQKVLGWFGGYGVEGTMGFYTGALHLPAAVGYLAIAAEFLGSLGLVVGLLGRGAALGIAAVMVGAIALVHLPNGFFMDWSGRMAGEGWEYHVLALALAGVVMVRGSGALSLDRALTSRLEPEPLRRAALRAA